MKTKQEFLLYLSSLRAELQTTSADTSIGADAFLESLSEWLASTKEKAPENFDWEFASKLIWAGAFYE